MKARGTSNLNFNVNDSLYLVDNNGNIYVTNVKRISPLTVKVLYLYKIYNLEKCEKYSIKDWRFNYVTIKGNSYTYSSFRKFCSTEQDKYYNLPEEELIIYRNYLQSLKTCIKLLIDKNK
jgi:hypothetical protein